MPIRPKPLPRRFNRSVSTTARRYAQKRQLNKNSRRLIKYKRNLKKVTRFWERSKVYILRGVLIALLSILLLVFALLLFSPLLHVRTIAIAKTSDRLDQEEIQQILAPLFNEHLFFIGRSDVETLLRANRSDIESVSIEKVYPSELRVIIEVQPVIAALKIQSPSTDSSVLNASGASINDFITQEGLYVQTVMPSVSGSNLPELTIVDWSVRPEPNQILIPSKLLAEVFAAEARLEEQFGQTVQERVIFVRAQEYHLVLEDRALWFDITSTLDEQFERYRIFLDTAINFPVTEYIDLRLQDRVIWK